MFRMPGQGPPDVPPGSGPSDIRPARERTMQQTRFQVMSLRCPPCFKCFRQAVCKKNGAELRDSAPRSHLP